MISYILTEHPTICESLFVTTEIFFIVGVMIHVFIIAVYVIDWRKGRPMSTSDQVIISIMISRMILQSVIQLNLFWRFVCAMCSSTYGLVFRILNSFAVYSSFWLSTLLSVVFYLKISNFQSVFFLNLRGIISRRILHFIIAFLLVSICQTFLIYIVYFNGGLHIVFLNSTNSYLLQPNHVSFVVSCTNMFGLLLIYFLSSLLLITSLYLHTKHMRCNKNMSSSLVVYYRIIKYMTGSLLTSMFYVIISVLADKYYDMFGFGLFSFSWTTFETCHSILLIYATPKLKDPLSMIFKCLSNYLIKRDVLC